MFALSRLTNFLISPAQDAAAVEAKPAAGVIDRDAVDTMYQIIRRSPRCTAGEQIYYAHRALGPLNLPRELVGMIQEELGADSSLMQTFVDRLSNAAQTELTAYVLRKTGVKVALHRPSPTSYFSRFQNVFSRESTEDEVLRRVLLGDLPADFALLMLPRSEKLRLYVSSKDTNRRSAFNFFTKAIDDSSPLRLTTIEAHWSSQQKRLMFDTFESSGRYIHFHYAGEDVVDDGRAILTAKRITYGLDNSFAGEWQGFFLLGGSKFTRFDAWHIDSRHYKAYKTENRGSFFADSGN